MRLSRPKKMVRVIRNLGQRLSGNPVEVHPETEVTAPMRPAPKGSPLKSDGNFPDTSFADSPFSDGFEATAFNSSGQRIAS